MIQYILWGLSFLALWLTFIWLSFLYIPAGEQKARRFPKVSICVPCWNEEKTVLNTLSSLLALDYPDTEILVVDDGSQDNTAKIVADFAKGHSNVFLIRKENGGKPSAVNAAIDRASGEFFSVVDADSFVAKDSLKLLIPYFDDPKCGAVTPRILVAKPKTFLERVQYFEYLLANMLRKALHNLGTLCITQGVLSTYRLSTLKEIGGFCKTRDNLTEDLEVALRLKSNGYYVAMETKAKTYTYAPNTLTALWRQRVRWYRGFIYNHLAYRHMFLSRKHGFFGMFQFPVNIASICVLLFTMLIFFYTLCYNSFIFVSRSLTIPGYISMYFTNFPTLKEIMLGHNVQVTLPLLVSLGLAVYLMFLCVRSLGESWRKHLVPFFAFFLVSPYYNAANWVASIYQEVVRTKRRWR
ncbi:glycosyltransferase [Candidatus Woesearchaeota archaeon]|nr:glycosyltransferase [Candidatus Woesearchaeota archaeon]